MARCTLTVTGALFNNAVAGDDPEARRVAAWRGIGVGKHHGSPAGTTGLTSPSPKSHSRFAPGRPPAGRPALNVSGCPLTPAPGPITVTTPRRSTAVCAEAVSPDESRTTAKIGSAPGRDELTTY